METKPAEVQEPKICLGCTEEQTFSVQKYSFLCFSWKKKPKAISNHTCQTEKTY